MTPAQELEACFGIAGRVRFEDLSTGLTLIRIDTPRSSATIAVQGAQVLRFQATAQDPIIWTSPRATFVPGKAIRGGVPVCWPWFGAHDSDARAPAHGLARTAIWQIEEAAVLADGSVRIILELPHVVANSNWWPHPATLRIGITVGAMLDIALATRNNGPTAFRFSQALHAYFQIADIGRIDIDGLDDCDYIDKVDGGARKHQTGRVIFTGETDRIYLGTSGRCEIRDPLMERTLQVAASGSRSTVIWNPWREKAAALGDMGTDGHLHMVCVETANAADDSVLLAPGDEHVLTARYAATKGYSSSSRTLY